MEDLVEEYEWVRRLALRLVADEASADDLAQDAILLALQKNVPVGRPARAWMAVVMRRLISHRWRDDSARRRRERVKARPSEASASEEDLVRTDLHRVLFDALLESREPVRSILLLRFRDGLETVEIARRLGMPGGTVRSHLSRGIEGLRERLDQRHGGDRRQWREAFLISWELARTPRGTSSLAPWPVIGAAVTLIAFSVGLYLAAFAHHEATDSTEVARADVRRVEPRDAGPVVSADSPSSVEARNAVAAHSATAPLEGEILDFDTNEAVPYFEVDVSESNGARESLWTDDQGRFRTARAFAVGGLELRYADMPGTVPDHRARIRHDHRVERGRASTASFIVRAGPRFVLDFEPPAGLRASDFEALLRGRGTERTIHGKGGVPRFLASVEDGPPPWVRFGLDVRSSATMGDPWTLVVSSRDGLWWGAGSADRITGQEGSPIEIALHPSGVIRGT
ncbi:MAG TPA: sigma-70 family RNA polymerase sigma factor, partial [Planctomycetota bacterium]|nr:sigma-70 family RNA polymerase sigma factor [Planctomycetota bacterium]